MLNFGRLGGIDSLSYGLPSQKHIDVVERQRTDPSTALGRFLQMGRGNILLPPPKNGSTKTMEELNFIVQRMAESTEEERDFAVQMDSIEMHYSMWAAEATRITGKEYDIDYFWRIGTKVEGLIDYLKMYYNRPRPYQLAPEYGKKIVRIIKDPRTASYPSGHAFDAWTFGTILSRNHPEHTERFHEIAEKVSMSRVVAGVHFPSDLRAGRKAAEWTIANILTEELE